MRTSILCVAALCLGGLVLGGCSSTGNQANGTNNNNAASATVPVTVSVRDIAFAPSAAVVVQMSFNVVGLSLVRADGAGSWGVLSNFPVAVQIQNNATNPLVISQATAPPTTYSSATVSLSNFSYEIINTAATGCSPLTSGTGGGCTVNGTIVGLPSGTCTTGKLCKITPTQNAATTQISTGTFPVTLNSSSALPLLLDFNVGLAIQSDWSIFSPTTGMGAAVTLGPLNASNAAGNEANVVAARGQITLLNSAGAGTFTMTQIGNGVPVVITTSLIVPTTYTGFTSGINSACTATTANTAACLAVGQNVSVTYAVPSSTPNVSLASNVTLVTTNTASAVCGPVAPTNGSTTCILNGVQGTVLANNGANFTLLVTGISATQGTSTTSNTVGPPEVAAIAGGTLTVGSVLTVTPTGTAAYGVLANAGGLTATTTPVLPACAAFTSIASIGPGQTVMIDIPIVGQTATAGGTSQVNNSTATVGTLLANSATADAIVLVPTQMSGTLPNPAPSGNNPQLLLGSLNAIYTAGTPAVTSVNVLTGPTVTTSFQGNLTGAVTGTNLVITGLTNSGVVRVSGLQYNGTCSPPQIAGASIVGLP